MSSARWQTPTSSAATADRGAVEAGRVPPSGSPPSPRTARSGASGRSIVDRLRARGTTTQLRLVAVEQHDHGRAGGVGHELGASPRSRRAGHLAASQPGSQRARCSAGPPAWIAAAAAAVERNGVAAHA